MTIKIYSCDGSRGMRPIWTAEEMGLNYEVEMMPFPPRFLHKEFMDINILGTIPYMIDGDIKMTESVAISQYLVEKYGPTDLQVMPDEADYPSYLNWLYHSDLLLGIIAVEDHGQFGLFCELKMFLKNFDLSFFGDVFGNIVVKPADSYGDALIAV